MTNLRLYMSLNDIMPNVYRGFCISNLTAFNQIKNRIGNVMFFDRVEEVSVGYLVRFVKYNRDDIKDSIRLVLFKDRGHHIVFEII